MSLSKAHPDDTDITETETSSLVSDQKKEYHAHFDCFSGAAGDMLLASCLDASGDPNHLKKHVTKCLTMGIPALEGEFFIRTKKVWRGRMGSIAGMHVTVVSKYNDKPAPVPKRKMDDDNDNYGDDRHDHKPSNHHNSNSNHDHGHGHEHQHGHQHHASTIVGTEKVEPDPGNNTNADHGPNPESNSRDHDHSHSHSHSHAHSPSHPHVSSHHHSHSPSLSHLDGPLRNLTEIRRLLEESNDDFIAPWVKTMAIATFTELAKAEATTHGATGIEDVHFHEVGAIDSIVDTVGTLVALHYLGATSFSCSRIPIGEGTVWTDHGILPVPAPATLRLLVGMPTCPGPIGVVTGELVTPTGAALLRTLCCLSISMGGGENSPCATQTQTGRPPNFTIRKIGIGAGTKDFERHPNILRLLIGDDIVMK